MKLLIISPGKRHDPKLADAIGEYERRLSSVLPVEWVFPATGTKESEGVSILKQIKEEDFVVLLDERGKEVNNNDLANLLETGLNQSIKRIVVIIGGAYGVSEEVSERADKTLKLSSLVFPHMLVRLMLVEQLYRAWSIRSGGKYHHE